MARVEFDYTQIASGTIAEVDEARRTTSMYARNHKRPTNTNFNSTKLVKMPTISQLAQFFECPVCYEITVPPIYTCGLGHNLCTSCRRKVLKCPVCRMEFSKSRNIFAEQLLAQCNFSCKHRDAGCTKLILGDKVTQHQLFCEFRPIRCPDCEKYIDHDKFLDHLVEEEVPVCRGTEVRTGYEIASVSLQGDSHLWEPTWIQAYDKNFFGMLECERDNWWIWVGMFGTRAEASEFQCEIVLWNKEKGMEMSYTGPAHSMRACRRQILEESGCLVTSRATLNSYLRFGGVDVIIKIKPGPYQPREEIIMSPCSNTVGNLGSLSQSGSNSPGSGSDGAIHSSEDTISDNVLLARVWEEVDDNGEIFQDAIPPELTGFDDSDEYQVHHSTATHGDWDNPIASSLGMSHHVGALEESPEASRWGSESEILENVNLQRLFELHESSTVNQSQNFAADVVRHRYRRYTFGGTPSSMMNNMPQL